MMFEVSNPISPAHVAAMNPAIPHVASMWLEPRPNAPRLAFVFDPDMTAGVLRQSLVSAQISSQALKNVTRRVRGAELAARGAEIKLVISRHCLKMWCA
jgi:hypothetical protein